MGSLSDLKPAFYRELVKDLQDVPEGICIYTRLVALGKAYLKIYPSFYHELLIYIEAADKSIILGRLDAKVEDSWELNDYKEFANPCLQLAADWLNWTLEKCNGEYKRILFYLGEESVYNSVSVRKRRKTIKPKILSFEIPHRHSEHLILLVKKLNNRLGLFKDDKDRNDSINNFVNIITANNLIDIGNQIINFECYINEVACIFYKLNSIYKKFKFSIFDTLNDLTNVPKFFVVRTSDKIISSQKLHNAKFFTNDFKKLENIIYINNCFKDFEEAIKLKL